MILEPVSGPYFLIFAKFDPFLFQGRKVKINFTVNELRKLYKFSDPFYSNLDQSENARILFKNGKTALPKTPCLKRVSVNSIFKMFSEKTKA